MQTKSKKFTGAGRYEIGGMFVRRGVYEFRSGRFGLEVNDIDAGMWVPMDTERFDAICVRKVEG